MKGAGKGKYIYVTYWIICNINNCDGSSEKMKPVSAKFGISDLNESYFS